MCPSKTNGGKRVLFVDDEPSIRTTLPAILELTGFAVTEVATVADALRAIHSQTFDVLIADLNIGEPGDGFTVVSAMRRTQPECRNFILTGYPAFATALEAIRQQVDEYFVKPADIRTMVQTINEVLTAPRRGGEFQTMALAALLREHAEHIVRLALKAMKSHPRLAAVLLTDKQREDHLKRVVEQLAEHLESKPGETANGTAAAHGETRQMQGYSPAMLVDDIRVLGNAIYAVVQENLLRVTVSDLIPDLCRVNDSLEAQLQESLNAFLEKDAA